MLGSSRQMHISLYLYKIQLFDFTLQIWMRISILATKMQIDIYIYTDVKS